MDKPKSKDFRLVIIYVIKKIALVTLYILPKSLGSYFLGVITRIRWPSPLDNIINWVFVKLARIDMSDATKDLKEYETIEDVFTRSLKMGSRPPNGTLCSPADGLLVISKAAEHQEALQAKGLMYDLSELVYNIVEPEARLRWFSTIYLAPHNYHRVHSPVSGQITAIRYFPGELWPVNQPFVKMVPGLFVRNERLVFDIELDGGGIVHTVMVGALNVGRITSPFLESFATNSLSEGRAVARSFRKGLPRPIKVGEEIGTFMLGSTVVLAFDEKACGSISPRSVDSEISVRVGDSLE